MSIPNLNRITAQHQLSWRRSSRRRQIISRWTICNKRYRKTSREWPRDPCRWSHAETQATSTLQPDRQLLLGPTASFHGSLYRIGTRAKIYRKTEVIFLQQKHWKQWMAHHTEVVQILCIILTSLKPHQTLLNSTMIPYWSQYKDYQKHSCVK